MKTDKHPIREERFKGPPYNQEGREMSAGGAHPSQGVEWERCSSGDVYPHGVRQGGEPDNGREAHGHESGPPEGEVSENLFRAYMREVGRIPLLRKEEERALAKEIQEEQRELVRRLLKLDPKIDELDSLTRKDRNRSYESLGTLMGALEKLERKEGISPGKKPLYRISGSATVG